MKFRMFLRPRYSIPMVASLAVVLFPMVFSTSIQAFRISSEDTNTHNLRQIADNDLSTNAELRQAISMAEDNYQTRGGHKSSTMINVIPYKALITVATIGLQPEVSSGSNMATYFGGDILHHHLYYRIVAYFYISPIAVVLYCLLIGGITVSLIAIPVARTRSSLYPRA